MIAQEKTTDTAINRKALMLETAVTQVAENLGLG
jgi:hypothetical protein